MPDTDEFVLKFDEVAKISAHPMGPAYWLLRVRVKAQRMLMFNETAEFAQMFMADVVEVRALWAATGGQERFQGPLLGEVENLLMQVLAKVDLQSASSRQEALAWLEELREACGSPGFVAVVHETAFALLVALLRCKEGPLPELKNAVEEMDGFVALPESERTRCAFRVWLSSHSDGLRLCNAAREALAARSGESEAQLVVDKLKVAQQDLLERFAQIRTVSASTAQDEGQRPQAVLHALVAFSQECSQALKKSQTAPARL